MESCCIQPTQLVSVCCMESLGALMEWIMDSIIRVSGEASGTRVGDPATLEIWGRGIRATLNASCLLLLPRELSLEAGRQGTIFFQLPGRSPSRRKKKENTVKYKKGGETPKLIRNHNV